jgi:hypothetical protein
MSVSLEGFDELMRLVNELEKVPQKVATKAARSGAQVDLTATKQDAPVYDGWLKASLKLVGERSQKGQSKKVYEITFDRAYNSKLVKISKSGKRSYYPVSQEYGWKYPNGGYHVGLQYMKNTARDKENEVEQKIVDVAKNEIDKILSTAR